MLLLAPRVFLLLAPYQLRVDGSIVYGIRAHYIFYASI